MVRKSLKRPGGHLRLLLLTSCPNYRQPNSGQEIMNKTEFLKQGTNIIAQV